MIPEYLRRGPKELLRKEEIRKIILGGEKWKERTECSASSFEATISRV